MNYPKISIIVLNWNGKEDTIECLESLKKLDYPNYEIIAVDNGSTDGSPRVLRERFPYITLIENDENLGFAEGSNVAMKHALEKGTGYVFLLNNDTIVDKGLLKELVKVAESDPKIGVVGPKIYFYDNPKMIWSTGGTINFVKGKADPIGIGVTDEGQFDKLDDRDCISGCALLAKREVLDKVGLFDPIYFAYYEEIDWCVKAMKAGYKMTYVPKARLWHKVSQSTRKDDSFRAYLYTRNRLIFMRKHAKTLDKLVFTIWFFLYEFPRFFMGAIVRARFDLAKAYLRAIGWHLGNRAGK